MRNFISFLFVLILLYACKEEVPVQPPAQVKQGSVLILNEGNYQWGNASVSVYDPENHRVEQDVFKRANDRPLGDVLQSITKWNDRLFLVVNNSQKIEEVEPATLKSVAVINGLISPRFMVCNGNKAYVSDLYGNAVSVIDLPGRKITGSISCKGWTEQMLLKGNRLYITNLHSNKLYMTDTDQDKMIDSLFIGFGSGSIVMGKDQRLWLSCKGNSSMGISPSISIVDTDSFKLIRIIPLSYEPTSICMNKAGDMVYYIHQQNIIRMPVTDTAYKQEHIFIPSSGRNLYGLGIHPLSGDIYVSDAKDFTQKGQVYRYSASGQLVTDFAAGIIPSAFYFGQ